MKRRVLKWCRAPFEEQLGVLVICGLAGFFLVVIGKMILPYLSPIVQ